MTQTSSTSKTTLAIKTCHGKKSSNRSRPEIKINSKLLWLFCFMGYLHNTISFKFPLKPNPSFQSYLKVSSFNSQDIKHPIKRQKKRFVHSNTNLKTNLERNKRSNKVTPELKISSTNYEKEKTISETLFSPPGLINSLKIASSNEKQIESDNIDVHQSNVLKLIRVDTFNNTTPIQIRRISHAPHMFHIKNFMSKSEREVFLSSKLNDSNTNISFEVAGTVSSKNESNITSTSSSPIRPHSKVAWISPIYSSSSSMSQKDDIKTTLAMITSALTKACASLLLSPSLFQETSKQKQSRPRFTFLGSEDLQLVQYKRKGEFKLHHDGVPRLLTVIFYVNGIAGTWFPLADVNKKQNLDKIPLNKGRALELMKGYVPGKNGILLSTASSDESNNFSPENKKVDGILEKVNGHSTQEHTVVPIEAGDAVAFYNYVDVSTIENSMDGNVIQMERLCEEMHGRIDWRALHAGLPADADEKWIATLWYLVKEEA